MKKNKLAIAAAVAGALVTGGAQGAETATCAGGCFWSVESEVEAIRGTDEFRGPDGHAWGG